MAQRRKLNPSRTFVFPILILLVAACSSAQAAIRILAITNAASLAFGLPANGGLATIFCTGLTGISGVVISGRVPVPLELAGVTVKVRGVPAPLLAVAATDTYQQINIQVPWERPSGTLPSVEISQNGESVRLDLSGYDANSRAGWGAFFSDGQGYGIIQHAEDYSLVTPERPARSGEILIAYATGLGDVSPPVPTGHAAPLEPFSWIIGGASDSVSVGERSAYIFFRGLAPGLVGVYQINFQVPDSVPAGDLLLSFSVRNCVPFGACGSPYFGPRVTSYGPSVKLPVR